MDFIAQYGIYVIVVLFAANFYLLLNYQFVGALVVIFLGFFIGLAIFFGEHNSGRILLLILWLSSGIVHFVLKSLIKRSG